MSKRNRWWRRHNSARVIDIANRTEAHAKIKRAAGITPQTYDTRTTELLAMLRFMRPANSQWEQDFVDKWVIPLGTEEDAFGNQWLRIGDAPILWSCHTDTVHRKPGAQTVVFEDGCAWAPHSSCLGADDTTGVWLMRNMIKAGVPGLYIFHRQEEIGGIGSAFIARETPELLAGIDFAIAFDRKGYTDIITDQMGVTASERFAATLAVALHPLEYEPEFGIFTDTQNYAELISECSNISVGYHAMHTPSEWQDVDFAMMLVSRLCSADFTQLVAARDPSVIEAQNWFYRGQASAVGWELDRYEPTRARIQPHEDYDRWWEAELKKEDALWESKVRRGDARILIELCKQEPDLVADFLESLGYTVADLKAYGGMV